MGRPRLAGCGFGATSIAIALYGIVRALRMGIVIDEWGVQVRSMGRDEAFAWSEVSSITCEPGDPDDRTRHVQVNVTGRKVPSISLGTYPRDVAEYEAAQLRAQRVRAVKDHG